MLKILLTELSLLAAQVHAQQTPFDCAGSAPHRQFDFWLGQWEVRDADGTLQGNNLIESVQRGCALREQWRSVRGGTGESLNYFDPGRGEWQTWFEGFYSRSGGDDSAAAADGQLPWDTDQKS